MAQVAGWWMAFLVWLDSRNWIHSVTVAAALYLTYFCVRWATVFAYAAGIDPVGKAAIVAAVTAPVCSLMGYVMKSYGDNRGPAQP